MESSFNIETAKWGEVKQLDHYDIALLPWGATEPHNGHLPYCTDVILSRDIALEAAEQVRAFGVNAMVLPGIPLGSQNPGQTGLPFCIHTRQETQKAVLEDIVSSLERAGIRRLLIVNGHGGNNFKGMIRDMAIARPDFLIMESEWFAFIPRKGYFEAEIDDHAGEQETSVMMHYHPELVRMEFAGEGRSRGFAPAGLNDKTAWAPRDWSRVSMDTGIGNPRASTPAKGAAYAEAVVARYVRLLRDVCQGDLY